MMVLRSSVVLMLVVGLSGCFEVPASAPQPAMPLPAEVCKQAREALDKLAEGGSFQETRPGEAAMSEQAWLELPQAQRDQLAQLLGYDAACQAEAPTAEQTIVIRSETGRIMTQQIVPTSADLSQILAE